MPNRVLKDQNYRFGFNGKEADREGQWGSTEHYDYGFRIYDPKIARFLSVDPLTATYPMLTPYQFASNRPIDGIDLDGLEYISYITNWYDGQSEPEIFISQYDPNRRNAHGFRGRGIQYVINYWKKGKSGFWEIESNKSFYYGRDFPYIEYGLYYGATGIYGITKEGTINKGVFDYSPDAIDAVDQGAKIHDQAYDAVGAIGKPGLDDYWATTPADYAAMDTWQEVIDLGVGGTDPFTGEPITRDEYNAAYIGVYGKFGIDGFKGRADSKRKDIAGFMYRYHKGRKGIKNPKLGEEAIIGNYNLFLESYMNKTANGQYTLKEGMWRKKDKNDKDSIRIPIP